MKNLCMHSGGLIKSQTTASMVVEFSEAGPVAWLTGSPHPCVALFQPWSFATLDHIDGPGNSAGSESFGEHLLSTGPVFTDYRGGEEYALQMREINRKISRSYPRFEKEFKPERDRVEAACRHAIHEGAIEVCRRQSYEYLQHVSRLVNSSQLNGNTNKVSG